MTFRSHRFTIYGIYKNHIYGEINAIKTDQCSLGKLVDD